MERVCRRLGRNVSNVSALVGGSWDARCILYVPSKMRNISSDVIDSVSRYEAYEFMVINMVVIRVMRIVR